MKTNIPEEQLHSKLANVEALFFDIDGTLVNSLHTIDPRITACVHRLLAQGRNISLASGRPAFAAKTVIEELNIKDPCVFFSGAAVVSPHDLAPIQSFPLPGPLVEEALQFGEDMEWHTELYSASAYAIPEVSELSKIHREYLFCEPTITNLRDYAQQEEILKIVYAIPEPLVGAKKEALFQRFPHATIGIGYGAAHPHISFVNFTSGKASREAAFETLVSSLRIDPSKTIAFGDGESDIPFLRLAEIGVAMGSASDEVQQSADIICEHVDEGGVLEILELLLDLPS